MDFKFCLLAGGRPPCSDPLIIYSRMCTGIHDDVIGAIFSNRNLNKKAIMAPWESPFHFEFSNSNSSAIPVYFKMPFWLMIDNNGPYPQ